MLDIQLLNQKASKLILFLKKADKILKSGKDTFVSTPMYPDRVQYYLISGYNELEEIACHLLKEIIGEKTKGHCAEKLANQQIFSEKINRVLINYHNYIQSIMEEKFSLSSEELYVVAKEITDTLINLFIKELAAVVKELKAKQPELAIPVNLKKVEKQAKAVKAAVRKISNFLNFPEEEFVKTPLFIDRARYFAVVLIDSSLWICRHIVRKLGEKAGKGKDCTNKLHQLGIISENTAVKMGEIIQYRDIFADPTAEFDPHKLYRLLKENLPAFLDFVKEIAKAIFKKK